MMFAPPASGQGHRQTKQGSASKFAKAYETPKADGNQTVAGREPTSDGHPPAGRKRMTFAA
jgi:hypothetical protein